MVTELRLAGSTTIDDAILVLNDFLPRYNERFRVPSQYAGTAYRVLDPGMCLDTVLCLKYRRRVGRDNTVKYRWRTMQLLPDRARPSYAGSVVEVLEGLDGQLAVQHEGRIVASQQAPHDQVSCAASARGPYTRLVPAATPTVSSRDRRMKWSQWAQCSKRTDSATMPTATAPQEFAGLRLRDPESPPHYRPARWKAVQKAKRKGLSIRGIAREVGIHRDTVRKYMNVETPPMARSRNVGSTVIS